MGQDRKSDALEALKMRILMLDLAPGSDLEESVLSEVYGISRTPLREVLQRLCGEGYAIQSPNRGTKVSSMDLSVLRCFFQTAPMIYSAVARLAAENRTQHQLDQLKGIQRVFSKAVGTHHAGDAALANHQFHALIGEMAANPYLEVSLARMLIDHTRLSQTFYRPASDREKKRVADASQQHDAMIVAFESRDAEEAVSLTLKHWDLSRDRMEDFVRPDPLTPEQEDAHAV